MEGYDLNEPEFEEGNNALNKSLEELINFNEEVGSSDVQSLVNSLDEEYVSMHSKLVENSLYVYSKVLEMNNNVENFMLYMGQTFPDNPYFSAKLASNRLNELVRAYDMFQAGELDSKQFSNLVKAFYKELLALGFIDSEQNTSGVNFDMNFDYEQWLDNGFTEGEEMTYSFLYNCYNNIYYNGIYKYLVEDDVDAHSTMFGVEKDELINFAERNLIDIYGVESFRSWRAIDGRDFERILARNLSKRDTEALDYLHSIHGNLSQDFWDFLTSCDSDVMTEEQFNAYFSSLSEEHKVMATSAISYYNYLGRYRYVSNDIMNELNDWIANDTAVYDTVYGMTSGKLGEFHNNWQQSITDSGGDYDGGYDFLYQLPATVVTGFVSGLGSVVENLIDGTVMITMGTLNALAQDTEELVRLFSCTAANDIKVYRDDVTSGIANFVGTDYCEKGYYAVESLMSVSDELASELYGPSSLMGSITGNTLLGMCTGNIGGAGSKTAALVSSGIGATKVVGATAQEAIQDDASFDEAYLYSMISGAFSFTTGLASSDIGYGADQFANKLWLPVLDTAISTGETYENCVAKYYTYAQYKTNPDGTPMYASLNDYMDENWGDIAKDAALTLTKDFFKQYFMS